MTQPLADITVADFSHVMAGPYASHLLRMLGARVIKIESKKGDSFRDYGGDRRFDGMSPAFIAANAGKKSIALDLKQEADAEIARRIVARSDVLLENFRPGVIARLGFGYEAVKALRPDIVFCSVSGYGQSGPHRDWPAIDNIVQATSGMMLLGGAEGDPPVRVGFPIVDTLTGQTTALAIISALYQRQKTGQGTRIDVSMFDSSLAFMTSALTPFLVTGQPMKRLGNTGYSGLPTAALFTTRDERQVSLGVVQANQFEALARYVGREDWLRDERFATPDARRANFDLMKAQLDAVFRTRDAADWEMGMSAVGIPCGMVRTVGEAAALASEEALLEIPVDGLGDLCTHTKIPGAGFTTESGAVDVAQSPPTLDGDRDEILNWLSGDD